MALIRLPPYAPELNPVEHLWDELREKEFANKVFDFLEAAVTPIGLRPVALGKQSGSTSFFNRLAVDIRVILIAKWNNRQVEIHA